MIHHQPTRTVWERLDGAEVTAILDRDVARWLPDERENLNPVPIPVFVGHVIEFGTVNGKASTSQAWQSPEHGAFAFHGFDSIHGFNRIEQHARRDQGTMKHPSPSRCANFFGHSAFNRGTHNPRVKATPI